MKGRCLSTRQSTIASQVMASAPIAPNGSTNEISTPPSAPSSAPIVPTGSTSELSTPSSAVSVQNLHPDLIQSLVSTVTEEVTRHLAAALPALPASSAPVPHEDRQPSSSQAPPVSATTLVNGAIAAAHSHITGVPQLMPTINVASSDTPGQIFLSTNLPIDSEVSAKLKGKIWNKEFVDFGSLLSNPGQDKYQLSVLNSVTGLPASFCLEPVLRPKKIMTIDAWQQAFHIFVGVYTQKYPHKAPALMKYGQTIRDLAARDQNWRFYDENFRYLRQT